jgi:hypothetical protein
VLQQQRTKHVNHISRPTLAWCFICLDMLYSFLQSVVDAFFLYMAAIAHKGDSRCLRSHAIVLHRRAFRDCTSLTSADFTGVESMKCMYRTFTIFLFNLCAFQYLVVTGQPSYESLLIPCGAEFPAWERVSRTFFSPCICPLQCICGSTTTRLIVPCAHQVNQRTTLVNHMERCLHRALSPDLLRSLLESTYRTFTVLPCSCAPSNVCLCDSTYTTQNTYALRLALTTRHIACTAGYSSACCALLLPCDTDVCFVVLANAHKSCDTRCLRSHTIALHSGAFFGCTSLTTADLTNVTSIGKYVLHLHDSTLFVRALQYLFV